MLITSCCYISLNQAIYILIVKSTKIIQLLIYVCRVPANSCTDFTFCYILQIIWIYFWLKKVNSVFVLTAQWLVSGCSPSSILDKQWHSFHLSISQGRSLVLFSITVHFVEVSLCQCHSYHLSFILITVSYSLRWTSLVITHYIKVPKITIYLSIA